MKTFPARLYVLLAREAPVGVVLRRGPSKQVRMIQWDLRDDTFKPGQWFKGRIYERRCDLSPDGSLLIYFAAKYKGALQSWTAISRPPWFTAVAVWPKGDGWNGGGQFVGPKEIALNHLSHESAPHSEFTAGCARFKVRNLATSRGEDGPIWPEILKRDGWMVENGSALETWSKPHPRFPVKLTMSIESIGDPNSSWYVIHYGIFDSTGAVVFDLGWLDWADWGNRGDLLFAREGRLFRLPVKRGKVGSEKLLSDFNADRFESIQAPDVALRLP
jgi:hypothetical protein